VKNDRLKIGVIILFFFCLSLTITYPLLFYFNQGIPYTRTAVKGEEISPLRQGDHLQLYYHFWLAKDALKEEYPFFLDPYEFSVEGIKIFTVRRFPLSILFVIFSVFGGAFAYNAVLILSVIFSGATMFLLAKLYLKSDFPSFMAGLIFALSPFGLSQLLGGHTNGFLWGLVPLAIFSLERLFSERKIRFGILYGFCLFSFALIEYHLLYYLTLFTLTMLPVRTITSLAKWKRANFNLKRALLKTWVPIFLSLFIIFLFVLFLKHIEISSSIAQKGRNISEVKLYSPAVKDLFRRTNFNGEKNIYLGITASVLAFLGLVLNLGRPGKDRKCYEEKINLLFFAGGLGITAILATGTSLNNIFPLYKFLYKFFPYFNYPRVPGRIIIVSFLCLAILGGYGVREIINLFSRIKKGKGREIIKIAISSIIFLGVFFDYNSGTRVGISLMDGKNRIYEIIKENAGDKKVLELPLWPGDTAWSSVYLYYVTLTRARIINGYYPLVPQEYLERIFYPLISLNLGDITELEYGLLKKLKVKYVIMHEDAFPQKVSHFRSTYSVRRLTQSPYLRFITRDKLVWLFELRDKPVFKKAGPQLRWVSGVVKRADQFHHRIGRLIDDPEAENGQALFASEESDPPGYLLFGRQQVFPRSSYKIIFHLKTGNNTFSEPIAVLDICTRGGKDKLVEKEIKGTDFKEAGKYQDFVLDFNQKEPIFPEFRLNFLKKADLWVDYVYILFAGEKELLYSYQAGELYYRGLLVEDEDTLAGKAVLFSPGFTRDKEVLYGPYRRYPKGNYQIFFRLKTDQLTDLPLAALEVASDSGREKIAECLIKSSDFKEQGEYQEFSFPFELEKEKIVEFRIIYPDKTEAPKKVFQNRGKLWVDTVRLEPIK